MRVLAFLFIVGCGGTTTPKDPFAAGACDAHWSANGFTDCQEGCVDSSQVLGANGSGCAAQLATGDPFTCVATFELGSAVGCCASDKPHLYFAECQ